MGTKEKIRESDCFMPCLIHRLSDFSSWKQEEHYERGISLAELKQSILSNIEEILNSRSHLSDMELENDPELSSSVLGYGLKDFCGCSFSIEKQNRLRDEIANQLRMFEPRLDPATLNVDLLQEDDTPKSMLEMEIRGQICAAKLDAELVFRSRFELDSGMTTIKVRDNG